MSPSPQMAPPGSSSYSSSTMSAGDGTWDSQRNSFLLPNLVGFNFATMRYNGMGNRFAGLPEYHSIIKGHGIVAAITFLLIIPTSLLTARYYYRRPHWALRAHIWLQIITVILTTVIFVLGWFAIGPERSLTNPHHGIGLAIYLFVLTQAIWGWFMHKREKGRDRDRPSLKLMIHQWYGRMIALLGIAQVGLGITLYGSPLVLFVLYAVALFILLCTFFVLSYRDTHRRMNPYAGSYTSSGTEIDEGRPVRRHSRLGRLAGVPAVGATLAALRNRSRNRSRDRRHSQVDVIGSHAPSESYIASEKYDEPHRGGGFRDRLLKIGAVAGAAGLAKRYFDRRRDNERDHTHPSAPLGGPHSFSEDNLSRLEEGRPPTRIPQQNVLHHRRSHSLDSLSSRSSHTVGGRRRGHKLRDGVATLGAVGLLRAAFKSRRERKEERRVEEMRRQEIESERLARQGSQRLRYTGDGFPPRGGRRNSLTSTDATSTTISNANPQPRYDPAAPPPIPAGYQPGGGAATAAGATAASAALADHAAGGVHAPMTSIPPPPPGGAAQGGMAHDSSGSDVYTSTGGRRHHRHHHPARDAAAAGAAAGLASSAAGPHIAQQAQASPGESVGSPPMSVKVKMNMHNNGRKVTLRRLPEAERAAEREARRRERRNQPGGNRRRRAGSASSLSGTDTGGPSTSTGLGGGGTWRRAEDIERMQAEELQRERQAEAQAQAQSTGAPPPRASGGLAPPPPPPPPPGAAAAAGPSSIGSPGTYDGNTTEASGDYASRRRRRRAERAAAQGYAANGPPQRAAGTVDYD